MSTCFYVTKSSSGPNCFELGRTPARWRISTDPDLFIAFRDRQAGSRNNREKPLDEGKEPQRRAFHARGDRGERYRNDRQSRTGQV